MSPSRDSKSSYDAAVVAHSELSGVTFKGQLPLSLVCAPLLTRNVPTPRRIWFSITTFVEFSIEASEPSSTVPDKTKDLSDVGQSGGKLSQCAFLVTGHPFRLLNFYNRRHRNQLSFFGKKTAGPATSGAKR